MLFKLHSFNRIVKKHIKTYLSYNASHKVPIPTLRLRYIVVRKPLK